MKKFWKWLFGTPKQQLDMPVVSKRFPFGDILIFNGKDYRYLYSYGDNDIFFEEGTCTIHMIPSKYTEAIN